MLGRTIDWLSSWGLYCWAEGVPLRLAGGRMAVNRLDISIDMLGSAGSIIGCLAIFLYDRELLVAVAFGLGHGLRFRCHLLFHCQGCRWHYQWQYRFVSSHTYNFRKRFHMQWWGNLV